MFLISTIWKVKTFLTKFLILAATLIAFISCKEVAVKPDNGYHADDSHFPSVEFYACHQHIKGIGVCVLDPNESLNHLNFYIQGYYQGTMHIFSTDCNVDTTFEYTDSELVAINLNTRITQSCEISFVVTPNYPGQNGEVIQISPFIGALKVQMRSKAGENVVPYATKLKDGFNGGIRIPVAGTGPYRVLIEGCDSKFDQQMSPTDGFININTNSFVKTKPYRICSMFGAVATKPKTTFIAWILATYDQKYIDLAIPKVKITSDSMAVIGESNTGVVAIGPEYYLGSEASFRQVDFTAPFTLRLISVGARSQIGDWSPKRGTFKWLL